MLDTTQVIRNATELGKLIRRNKSDGKKLDKSINLAAVSGIVMAHAVGNIKPIRLVLAQMAKGHRNNAMKGFIENYSPVVWNDDDKQFDYQSDRRDFDYESSDKFLELLGDDWVDYKPEQGYKPIDFSAKVLKICAEATTRSKAIANGKAKGEGDAIDIAAVRAVKAVTEGDIDALELYIEMLKQTKLEIAKNVSIIQAAG